MSRASYNPTTLAQCETLGYIQAVVNFAHNCALIRDKIDGRYYLLPLGYKQMPSPTKGPWRVEHRYSIGRFGGRFAHDFEEEDSYEAWWRAYLVVKGECHNRQIYI